MTARTVEVPDALDELLTPAWLTAALSPRFPGVHVTAVTRGPVVERLSTNARFRIECSPPEPVGLSPTLCVKGYFSEQGRSMGSAGEPEASFYRDLADDTGVRTLRSVWADVHPDTRHGVVITEDGSEPLFTHGGAIDARQRSLETEPRRELPGAVDCSNRLAWADGVYVMG